MGSQVEHLHMKSLPFSPQVPFMTLDKFAQQTGMPLPTVRDQANKGLLPITQRCKKSKRYVDLVQLHNDVLETYKRSVGV